MRRLLFWITAAMLATNCHPVPESSGTDAGSDTTGAAKCAEEDREWVAEPVFVFEDTEVEFYDLWTDGERGWVGGHQNRVGTRHAVVWRLQADRAILEYERLDRDGLAFRAIDCIEPQSGDNICVAVGRKNTAAVLQDGEWRTADPGGGNWVDVVGTGSKFLAVDGQRVISGVVNFTEVMGSPAVSRIGCFEEFCAAADQEFVYLAAGPAWPRNGWEMPCATDEDLCTVNAVEVPDEGVVMAVTDTGFVYRTTDGGENWSGTDAPVAPLEFVDLSMLNASHGWLLDAGGSLRKTMDGESWDEIPLIDQALSTARRVHVYAENAVWVATDDSVWDVRHACPR